MCNITYYLEYWKNQLPEKNAFCFLDCNTKPFVETPVTWNTLYEKSYQYACYFQKQGVRKGDCIVITAEQSPETVYTIYGTLLLGAIFILVPPLTDEEKIERMESTIESSGARYLFNQSIPNHSFEASFLEHITLFTPSDVTESNVDYLSIKTNIEDSDIALLQYTSGSTSKPKGVMLTHKNIMAGMEVQMTEYPCDSSDIYVTWLPFFHTMELSCGLLFSLFTGRQQIVIQTDDYLTNPVCWFEALSSYQATITVAPISGYVASVNMIKANSALYSHLDFSSIHYMVSSSEAVHKKQVELVYKVLSPFGLKPHSFLSGLGMTEALTIFTITKKGIHTLPVEMHAFRKKKIVVNSEDSEEQIRLTTVGIPGPGVSIKIINPITLNRCDTDEIGEIWYQGDLIAAGYWNMEKETEEVFRARYVGNDTTFFRSGDMGFLRDGELYLTGRRKDCIIINGKNIFLTDIEQTIRKYIKQLEHCILKATNIIIDGKEQLLLAFESRHKHADFNSLAHTINQVIARFFHINAYDIVITKQNGLPRTDNGKISPERLKIGYRDKSLDCIYTLKSTKQQTSKDAFSEIGLKIKNIFESILHVKCSSKTDDYYALGGTSLNIVQLIKQINNEFNICLSLDVVLETASIGDLEKHVRDALNS